MADPFDFGGETGVKAGQASTHDDATSGITPPATRPPKSRTPLYVAAGGCGCVALMLVVFVCGGLAALQVAKKVPALAGGGIDRARVVGFLFDTQQGANGNTILFLQERAPGPPRVFNNFQDAHDHNMQQAMQTVFECRFDRALPGVENLINGQRLVIAGKNVGTADGPILEHSEIVSR